MKTLKQGLDRFLATVCIIDFIGMVLLTGEYEKKSVN